MARRVLVECLAACGPWRRRSLQRVIAVHQDLGLDNRNDVRLLAERRIARKRMRVRAEREVGGQPARR